MEFKSLPLEIHLEIFSYLPVRDVMSVRRVCKLWNGLINSEFKFKRLRCSQMATTKHNDNRSNYYDFHIAPIPSFLDYVRADSKFNRLSCLIAFLSPKSSELEDAFDFLNSFKSLKELWISCYYFDLFALDREGPPQKQFVISLPRLEKANLFIHLGSNVRLLLDLPTLLCLSIDSLAGITVGHPENLRTLATRSLFGNDVDYSLFTNLMNIFTRANDVRSITASFLEKLPCLSELHLDSTARLPANYQLPEPSVRKARPKIFYFGLEFSVRELELEGEQWPNVGANDPSEAFTQFIAQNLHRSLDRNQHITAIQYNPIAGELNDSQMFGVLLERLSKIRQLHINGTVADENRLLKFIDKARVSNLRFRGTALTPCFFEKLAANGQAIQFLRLSEPTMDILSDDFNFIFKFQNLSSLHLIDCPLGADLVTRVLKELKHIRAVAFTGHRDFSFTISRLRSKTVVSVGHTVGHTGHSRYEIPTEETSQLVDALKSRSNADGSVCVEGLQILLRHLQLEKKNALFWMRKYLYDQRHSICLSVEQMRLLNLRH